jgi:hypothetical protein
VPVRFPNEKQRLRIFFWASVLSLVVLGVIVLVRVIYDPSR